MLSYLALYQMCWKMYDYALKQNSVICFNIPESNVEELIR